MTLANTLAYYDRAATSLIVEANGLFKNSLMSYLFLQTFIILEKPTRLTQPDYSETEGVQLKLILVYTKSLVGCSAQWLAP